MFVAYSCFVISKCGQTIMFSKCRTNRLIIYHDSNHNQHVRSMNRGNLRFQPFPWSKGCTGLSLPGQIWLCFGHFSQMQVASVEFLFVITTFFVVENRFRMRNFSLVKWWWGWLNKIGRHHGKCLRNMRDQKSCCEGVELVSHFSTVSRDYVKVSHATVISCTTESYAV